MLAAFSGLFTWYQLPILAVLILMGLLFRSMSKRISRMSVYVRRLIVFGQFIILFLLVAALILPSLNCARNLELLAVCRTRLKGLGTAIELYHQEYKLYPPSPKEMIETEYASIKNFKCPLDTQDRKVSYFYLPPLETDDGKALVMCDFKDNHQANLENTRCVLIKDGEVKKLSEEEFQAELAQPHNARFAAALKQAEEP